MKSKSENVIKTPPFTTATREDPTCSLSLPLSLLVTSSSGFVYRNYFDLQLYLDVLPPLTSPRPGLGKQQTGSAGSPSRAWDQHITVFLAP